jgi:Zn-dependent protease with chaperone function
MGLGSSQRVVVWDTTVKQMTTPEIMFVLSHEMGHYALGHFLQEMLFSEALLVVGLWAGFRVFNWALGRYGEAWGLRGAGDWASLPVLLLLLLLFGFVCTPAINAFSRHCERQADQYGIELMHDLVPDASRAAAKAFQILGDGNLEEPAPSPLVEWWFYNHPSTAERIRFADTYNPWTKGQSPQFVK